MRLVFKKPLFWLPVLLLASGLAMTGCESDPVAPHDELPALTPEGAAQQAGVMASGLAQTSPQLFYTLKNAYTYSFVGIDAIDGTVYLEFRDGGEEGTLEGIAPNAADWGWIYTAADEPLDFMIEVVAGSPGHVYLSFDIKGDIDQPTHTATLLEGSGGSYVAGEYTGTFDFSGVVVTQGADSPTGTMTVQTNDYVVTVVYDGDSTALLTIADVGSWLVDLDDGTLTAADG